MKSGMSAISLHISDLYVVRMSTQRNYRPTVCSIGGGGTLESAAHERPSGREYKSCVYTMSRLAGRREAAIMRTRPVLLLLLGLVLAGVALGDTHGHDRDHDHQDDHGQDDHHDHHDHSDDFTKIDHRLDKLTARMEAIRDSVHKRTDPGTITKARSIRHRVQKLEGAYHIQGGPAKVRPTYIF